MTKYSKGEWTNARYDICEIECDGEVYCTVATKDVELNIDVLNENEQLKQENRGLQSELGIFKEDVTHSNQIINKLNDENEQLKQRNTRQAKQLDRLYNLIEQKDWRALNDILDDFKKCDEQLQKEWGTYGDVE